MRTHLLTLLLNPSTRFKRLFLGIIFIILLGFISSKSLSFQDPLNEDSFIIPSDLFKNNYATKLINYFYEDDNYNIHQDTKSDLNENEFKDKFSKHLDSNSNEISTNFYSKLILSFNSIKDQIPKIELPKRISENRKDLWSKKNLLEFIDLSKDEVNRLKQIHSNIYDSISNLKFPKNLYKGTGIVFIGGGKYSWLSLLSIKSLRSFGCNLPIEMIIPTKEEYEHDLCEEILPALNGKCILLDNVLGKEVLDNVKFEGYQYKSLALIASSFDNTLLLDSDNILISNPENFFKSEVYNKYGLIVWPDYWKRTTSPFFYEIADIKVNENLQVRDGRWLKKEPKVVEDLDAINYHDLEGTIPDISSESGQILLRKNDHLKTILLSFFYNIYGPNFFYPLISQGESGEGDKDTFIAAAVKSNETFYQVKSEIRTFGYKKSDGNFNGVSMGQKNPSDDYEQFVKMEGEEFDIRSDAVRVFTIHANFPKLDPYQLLKEKKLVNDDGKEMRLYSDIGSFLEHVDGKEYDFEMVQFQRMKFLLCQLNVSLKYFNNIRRDELCGFIDSHIAFMKNE